MVIKRKLLATLLFSIIFSLKVDSVYSSPTTTTPSPLINIRQIVGDLFLDSQPEIGCCPIGSRIYTFPTGINQKINSIEPLMDVGESSELEIKGKIVKHFTEHTATGLDYAYYVKSEKGNSCIGYALFEYIGTDYADKQGNELLDIRSVLVSKGFNSISHPDGLIISPSSTLQLTFYEKQHSNYIERIVVGSIPSPNPFQAVLAEMFYPQDMDDAFRSLLIPWLMTQVDFYNNFHN